ncbi:hypothetical protein [Labrys miyagiensis]
MKRPSLELAKAWPDSAQSSLPERKAPFEEWPHAASARKDAMVRHIISDDPAGDRMGFAAGIGKRIGSSVRPASYHPFIDLNKDRECCGTERASPAVTPG